MKNLINKNQNNVAQNLNNKGENTMIRNLQKANEFYHALQYIFHKKRLSAQALKVLSFLCQKACKHSFWEPGDVACMI